MPLLTHQHHLDLCLCLFCYLSRAYAPLLPPTAAAPVPEARLSCDWWIFQRLDAFILLNIYFRVREWACVLTACIPVLPRGWT